MEAFSRLGKGEGEDGSLVLGGWVVYDPESQYRCAIIRTRGRKEVDDLLFFFAKIIDDLCPLSKKDFESQFDKNLSKYRLDLKPKARQNYRTEVVGKLFGMYFENDGLVLCSEHTKKLLRDSDQPAFFKDICWKMQFPNGMWNSENIRKNFEKSLRLHPCIFLVHFLDECHNHEFRPTIDEVGYYILNNLDVLKGESSPSEVLRCMMDRRESGIYKKVDDGQGKARSYYMQHIEDILGYMELANLIAVKRTGHGKVVSLNRCETKTIKNFLNAPYNKLRFPIYSYSLNTEDEFRKIPLDYGRSMSELSFRDEGVFRTPLESILVDAFRIPDVQDVGTVGERIVYEYEREKAKEIDASYADKVENVSSKRGLGYDIRSIRQKGKSFCDIYIEVKSTVRTTDPKRHIDSVELTQNEWGRAKKELDDYFIYRVYLNVQEKKWFLYTMRNPFAMAENGRDEVSIARIGSYRLSFEVLEQDCVLME